MPAIILISVFPSFWPESYTAAPYMVGFIPVLSVSDLRAQVYDISGVHHLRLAC